MDRKLKYVDINFEEISPDRNISDSAWSNGLHTYRWSVAPSSGGCIIPSMCYMMIEYSFGSADGASNAYSPVKALLQNKKIALQNNWVSCAYNACRFTAAQSEISIVNSSHAQVHTLKRRMNLDTTFIEKLGADYNGFDPDFSRRLARVCSDGVYHRDGLIDCSPYNSNPLSTIPQLGSVALFNQNQNLLTTDAKGRYIGTELSGDTLLPTSGNVGYIFKGFDGVGDIAYNDAGNTNVNSFLWQLPPYSAVPGTVAQNDAVVDASHILPGDILVFVGAGGAAIGRCTVASKRVSGSSMVLVMNLQATNTFANMTTFLGNSTTVKAGTGIESIERIGGSPYLQADPRSNLVHSVVMYQPPVSFFDISNSGIFFGDMELSLTPNPNYAKACVESVGSGGGYYNEDVKHGTDYAFGIKSARLYIARARMTVPPPTRSLFTTRDFQVSNKALTGGSSVINFNVPPSTHTLVAWIQDNASGTHSMLPLTRFKTRQDTNSTTLTPGAGLTRLERFGPWAHTYDERLQSIQMNFAGITKTMTSFQRGSNSGSISDSTVNNMLQRWVMNLQMDGDRQHPETYSDWLNCGPYYVFNFERSADNQGTFLTVYINYEGALPFDGMSSTSTTPSGVNLYVCAIYDRDVAITYSEYGNIVSVQTQMR